MGFPTAKGLQNVDRLPDFDIITRATGLQIKCYDFKTNGVRFCYSDCPFTETVIRIIRRKVRRLYQSRTAAHIASTSCVLCLCFTFNN